MPTLDQLKYALSLEKHGHFGIAAKDSHVSQPALSTQVKNLEEELGMQLFDRSHTPITPTDEGKMILDQARKVVKEEQGLLDLASQSRSQNYFEIRLGILPTIAPYLVPELIKVLRKTSPVTLKLSLFELTTRDCLQRLKEGSLEGALLATDLEGVPAPDLEVIHEPFVVYFHKDHKALKNKFVSTRDLNPSEAWLLADGHCLREQALGLCAPIKHKDRSISFESGSLETLLHVVDQSGGFTIMPASCVASFGVRRAQLRRFKFPEPHRTLGLLKSRPSLKPQGFLHLSKKLSESFNNLLKNSGGI